VFPEVRDAAWVIVDRTRPDVFDRLDPAGFAYWLDRLRARGDFRLVFDRDGVTVFRRVGGEGG
jgi:hypothetical protein